MEYFTNLLIEIQLYAVKTNKYTKLNNQLL